MNKCLLAIKDPELLNVLSELLHRHGYSPVCSSTSADARKLIPLHQLDLLVVSWNIDTEGAPPLIEEARRINSRLPVVTLAGSYSQNEWDRLIPGLQAVAVQTGSIRELMPSVRKAEALMTTHSLRLLWETEMMAETIFDEMPQETNDERLQREAFLAQFMARRKTALEALAEDFKVPQHEIFGLIPGTRLPDGKGCHELIELRFWIDCLGSK